MSACDHPSLTSVGPRPRCLGSFTRAAAALLDVSDRVWLARWAAPAGDVRRADPEGTSGHMIPGAEAGLGHDRNNFKMKIQVCSFEFQLFLGFEAQWILVHSFVYRYLSFENKQWIQKFQIKDKSVCMKDTRASKSVNKHLSMLITRGGH